jgi:hypothetical protein
MKRTFPHRFTFWTIFFISCAFGVDLHNPPPVLDFNNIPIGSATTNVGPDMKIRCFLEPLDVVPDPLLPAICILLDSANPPADNERQKYIGSPYVCVPC